MFFKKITSLSNSTCSFKHLDSTFTPSPPQKIVSEVLSVWSGCELQFSAWDLPIHQTATTPWNEITNFQRLQQNSLNTLPWDTAFCLFTWSCGSCIYCALSTKEKLEWADARRKTSIWWNIPALSSLCQPAAGGTSCSLASICTSSWWQWGGKATTAAVHTAEAAPSWNFLK